MVDTEGALCYACSCMRESAVFGGVVDAVGAGDAYIKIHKSLTYRGDKSTCIYCIQKNFSGGIFECLIGFIKMEKVVPIKTN